MRCADLGGKRQIAASSFLATHTYCRTRRAASVFQDDLKIPRHKKSGSKVHSTRAGAEGIRGGQFETQHRGNAESESGKKDVEGAPQFHAEQTTGKDEGRSPNLAFTSASDEPREIEYVEGGDDAPVGRSVGRSVGNKSPLLLLRREGLAVVVGVVADFVISRAFVP